MTEALAPGSRTETSHQTLQKMPQIRVFSPLQDFKARRKQEKESRELSVKRATIHCLRQTCCCLEIVFGAARKNATQGCVTEGLSFRVSQFSGRQPLVCQTHHSQMARPCCSPWMPCTSGHKQVPGMASKPSVLLSPQARRVRFSPMSPAPTSISTSHPAPLRPRAPAGAQ